VRHGTARPGMARRDEVWLVGQGLAKAGHGMAELGKAWLARHG
jgi:hypothetical protein